MSDKNSRKKCSKCNKSRFRSRDYYMSNSDKHSDGLISVCKQCILKDISVGSFGELRTKELIEKIQDILLDMNRPYLHKDWISSVDEAEERSKSQNRTPAGVFGLYLKNINLNHGEKNWRDSEFVEDLREKTKSSVSQNNTSETRIDRNYELNEKNRKDVLRLLGYDPFEAESDEDKPMLYNRLIDYLSEDILEDGFRLSSVIAIVRTFNQIDRLDATIATSQPSNLGALTQAKQRLHGVVNSIAKENGISIGANAKNTAGSGTLTGIMRQLDDYDFHEADVNLFDIETAGGIRQVADISNKSIAAQLSFDENDYTEMLQTQRELLEKFERDAKKFEEDNRLLRVEINKRNKKEEEMKEEIKGLKKRIEELMEVSDKDE